VDKIRGPAGWLIPAGWRQEWHLAAKTLQQILFSPSSMHALLQSALLVLNEISK